MGSTRVIISRDSLPPGPGFARLAAAALCVHLLAAPCAMAQVYRWVDEEGVTHLSSEKPPPGVRAERVDIPGTGKRSSTTSTGSTANRRNPASPAASPEQVARRDDLLGSLRTRECVIALEALDRKTSGAEATSANEIRRLKQTAELNCSRDTARRREQEEMAAKLRVANSPSCVQARNLLADMLSPDATFPREQVRSQQKFVDEYCTAPVR